MAIKDVFLVHTTCSWTMATKGVFSVYTTCNFAVL